MSTSGIVAPCRVSSASHADARSRCRSVKSPCRTRPSCRSQPDTGIGSSHPACPAGTNAAHHRPGEFEQEPPGLVIHPDDAIGMRVHPGISHLSGCCGISPVEGRLNLVCESCGAELATTWPTAGPEPDHPPRGRRRDPGLRGRRVLIILPSGVPQRVLLYPSASWQGSLLVRGALQPVHPSCLLQLRPPGFFRRKNRC